MARASGPGAAAPRGTSLGSRTRDLLGEDDWGVVVRVLDALGPRGLALALMPVLVVASAVQPQDPLPGAAGGSVTAHAVHDPRALDAGTTAAAATPAGREADAVVDLVVDSVAAPAAYVASSPVHQRASRRTRLHLGAGALSLQERGQAALRALGYDWQALGYAVRFRPYQGGRLGSANRKTRTITVYVQQGQSELSLRVSLAHELGHALDFEHGTAERRDRYRRLRGLSTSTPWFPCNRCSDYASPAGDFAEVFAVWLAGPGDFRSRLKGVPTAAELRELAPLFRLPRAAAAPAPARAGGPSPAPSPSPERQLPDLLGPPPSPGPDRG